ncbi:hypothetical protein [Lacinutrix algicola]|uniref:hypothetical protein n=1 Tax=Lacinutrix algicola TaxID=342954 RepID=UPI000AC8B9A1|nr:hypothetical protein [Lacinutrix algicola]
MKPYYKEAFDFINTFQPVRISVYDIASYKEKKEGDKLLELGVIQQKKLLNW